MQTDQGIEASQRQTAPLGIPTERADDPVIAITGADQTRVRGTKSQLPAALVGEYPYPVGVTGTVTTISPNAETGTIREIAVPNGRDAKPSGAQLPAVDPDVALEFYKSVQQSAFNLDCKQGRRVTSNQEFQMLVGEAAEKQQGLFFQPATVKDTWAGGTTAKKDEILECPYLWGDCDAEKFTGNDPADAAKHYESEGSRVRSRIDQGLQTLSMKPYAIWRSGAGWQFLIKLDQPIPPDDAEQLVAKLHNALGFDPVVKNCNRLLRVPGSVNWKTGKDGRVPSPCGSLSIVGVVTKVDEVRAALATVSEREAATASNAIDIKIDWSKVKEPGWLKSVNELPADASQKLRVIVGHTGTLKELNTDLIARGMMAKGYGSWSEVTCALAAAFKSYSKYSLEEIAEALLADLACNQHVARQRDKQRAVERAIVRSHNPNLGPSAGGGHWPGGQSEETGKPIKNILNTIEAIQRLGITCTWDEFRQKEYWYGHADKSFDGEMSDAAVAVVRRNIFSQFRFYPSVEDTRDAITVACRDNKSNPVLDYFSKLAWDGTPRLDKLLHTYLGADDIPLNEAISRKVTCAIVRRAKQPGCKFDHQLVLQCGQGIRKSMFCEDLAVFPDLFTDAGDLSGSIKEQMEIGQGKQIIEFPEHAGFSRAARDKNKAALSRKVDRARMAYGHYATDTPRRWVAIATINPGGYLNDPTGERRYWHVGVKFYDREAFLADKDQLYAEAVVREANERLWLDTSDLVKAHDKVVAGAKEPNELMDQLRDLRGEVWSVGGKDEERVSAEDIRFALGMTTTDAARSHTIGRRIAEAMMELGWTKAPATIRCHKDGQPTTGYTRPVLVDPSAIGPTGPTDMLAEAAECGPGPTGPTGPAGSGHGCKFDGLFARRIEHAQHNQARPSASASEIVNLSGKVH